MPFPRSARRTVHPVSCILHASRLRTRRVVERIDQWVASDAAADLGCWFVFTAVLFAALPVLIRVVAFFWVVNY